VEDVAASSANEGDEGFAVASSGDSDRDHIIASTTVSDATTKKTWKRKMPKKKNRGFGNSHSSKKKKTRAQYNEEVAAAAAVTAVDNQPIAVEMENSSSPPQLTLVTKPKSQLIRLISSKDNAKRRPSLGTN